MCMLCLYLYNVCNALCEQLKKTNVLFYRPPHQSSAESTEPPYVIEGDQDESHCTESHIEQGQTTQDRSYCPWFYQMIINESRCVTMTVVSKSHE